MTEKNERYSFNSCLIDLACQELMVDGEVRLIEPQVLDLSVYLIINRDRLVTYIASSERFHRVLSQETAWDHCFDELIRFTG